MAENTEGGRTKEEEKNKREKIEIRPKGKRLETDQTRRQRREGVRRGMRGDTGRDKRLVATRR